MLIAGEPGCTCGRLRKAARVASRFYDKHLAPAGLNVGQYSMLSHIARMEAPSISELADSLDMERTTLTRNLSPLERCGYVVVRAGIDRRSKAVILSRAGHAALAGARPLWLKAQAEIDAALGDISKNSLHDELDRSIVRMREAFSAAQ